VSLETTLQKSMLRDSRCAYAQIQKDGSVKILKSQRDANAVFLFISYLPSAGASEKALRAKGDAFLNTMVSSKIGKVQSFVVKRNGNSATTHLVATMALADGSDIGVLFEKTKSAYDLMCLGKFEEPSRIDRLKSIILGGAVL